MKTGRSTSQNNNAARLLHYKIPKPFAVLKQDSPNDDTLILSVNHHVSVHVISQGVDVGWILILGLRRKRLVFSSGSQSAQQFEPQVCKDCLYNVEELHLQLLGKAQSLSQ